MLLRNGLSSNSSPLTLLGMQGRHFFRDDQQLFKNAGGLGLNERLSVPMGSGPYNAISMPKTAGDMSMYATASGAIVADLIPTWPMAINLTGSGTLAAEAALSVAMGLALSGSGSLSASIIGLLNMECDLSGSGSLAAAMEGVASLAVDMLGEGGLEATIAAYGDMAIDIVVTGTGLSTANVGSAVWNALAATFNEPGTMGSKVNTASSGGVDMDALAEAVWANQSADDIAGMIEFLTKIVKNKREITADKNLVVYDDNGTTPILHKALADKDGGAIADLASGVLASEGKSSVP